MDTSSHEPKTDQVDELRDGILKTKKGNLPALIIGIGGGSVASISELSSEIDLDDVVRTICAALSGFGGSGSRPQDTNSMRLNAINSCVIQVTCECFSGFAKCIC